MDTLKYLPLKTYAQNSTKRIKNNNKTLDMQQQSRRREFELNYCTTMLSQLRLLWVH